MFKKLNMRGISHHFLLPIVAVLIVVSIGGYIMQRSSSASTVKESCTNITFGRYKNSHIAKYKPCVKAIQKKVGANADGIFGNNTQSRIKTWQKNHGLTADGVVGRKTWTKMGIKPTYKVTISTAARYSYKKCTYAYASRSYTVSYGIPPKIKCSPKTTTNLGVAKESIEINRSISQRRTAHVKMYNSWIEKRTGGDQAGQQSITSALKWIKLN